VCRHENHDARVAVTSEPGYYEEAVVTTCLDCSARFVNEEWEQEMEVIERERREERAA
jgi:hypothetical protein